MKKGFTLAELLGVIVILGLIALLSFPPIVSQIKKSKKEIDEGNLIVIQTAFERYKNENAHKLVFKKDTDYCIKLKTLVNDGKLDTPIKNSDNNEIDVNLTYLRLKSNNTYDLVTQLDIDKNVTCEIIEQ